MATPRRMGSETSETRFLLLEVTERVMLEDGYAAVSSRRIAKEAGVTPALVHYYFGTLDDLFIEVLRRRGEQQLERQQRQLSSPQPLRALWKTSTDESGTALLMEFMALATHRKVIRAELAAYAEQFRKAQLDSLRDHLEEVGIDTKAFPPEALVVTLAALASTIIMEEALGMETGLRETRDLVERFLTQYEGPPEPRVGAKRARKPSPS
jgi:AcrR family transcriptional regulator